MGVGNNMVGVRSCSMVFGWKYGVEVCVCVCGSVFGHLICVFYFVCDVYRFQIVLLC